MISDAKPNFDATETQALEGLIAEFRDVFATNSDGIRDREVKQHLLLGGACTLNEALNQALNIEAAKAAAWPTPRLR
jgi:hypothetical protein